jgi:hypothetical protein
MSSTTRRRYNKRIPEQAEILKEAKREYQTAKDAVLVEQTDLGNIYVILDEFSNALCEAWYDSRGRFHSRPAGYDPHKDRLKGIS